MNATLEKSVQAVGPYEYRVLTTTRDSSLQQELNDAASQGFQLVRGGVFVKPTRARGLELAAVIERAPSRSATYQYVVLSTKREATLKNELATMAAQHYEAVARLYRGDHVTFLERPAATRE